MRTRAAWWSFTTTYGSRGNRTSAQGGTYGRQHDRTRLSIDPHWVAKGRVIRPFKLSVDGSCCVLWRSSLSPMAWHSSRADCTSSFAASKAMGRLVPAKSAICEVALPSLLVASWSASKRTRHVSQERYTLPQCYGGFRVAAAPAFCLMAADPISAARGKCESAKELLPTRAKRNARHLLLACGAKEPSHCMTVPTLSSLHCHRPLALLMWRSTESKRCGLYSSSGSRYFDCP